MDPVLQALRAKETASRPRSIQRTAPVAAFGPSASPASRAPGPGLPLVPGSLAAGGGLLHRVPMHAASGAGAGAAAAAAAPAPGAAPAGAAARVPVPAARVPATRGRHGRLLAQAARQGEHQDPVMARVKARPPVPPTPPPTPTPSSAPAASAARVSVPAARVPATGGRHGRLLAQAARQGEHQDPVMARVKARPPVPPTPPPTPRPSSARAASASSSSPLAPGPGSRAAASSSRAHRRPGHA